MLSVNEKKGKARERYIFTDVLLIKVLEYTCSFWKLEYIETKVKGKGRKKKFVILIVAINT